MAAEIVKINPMMKARALLIMQKQVMEGKTQTEIARELNIHPETVKRTLQRARQANVFVEYEDRLFDELLPLAHEAVKTALADGDAQIGLEILKGTNVLKKQGAQGQAAQQEEDDLYAAIRQAREQGLIDVTPADGVGRLGAGEPSTVEADDPDLVLPVEDPDGITAAAPPEVPTRFATDDRTDQATGDGEGVGDGTNTV